MIRYDQTHWPESVKNAQEKDVTLEYESKAYQQSSLNKHTSALINEWKFVKLPLTNCLCIISKFFFLIEKLFQYTAKTILSPSLS